MSGHSKWHNIRIKKGKVDAQRGKAFTKVSREILIAARRGGADPSSNYPLKTAIARAREVNMPMDNIKRVIEKATGEGDGAQFEEIVYEGYAPGGVGLIVEVTTDNKNRAAAEVRQAFNDNGGNMAQTGAVSHSFQKKGQFLIGASQIGEDALMELVLEAGADDVVNNGDHFEVLSPISAFDSISKALQEKSIKPESAELAYISSIPVPVGDAAVAKQVLELIDALEALDDVKAVHGNQEIDEKLMQ